MARKKYHLRRGELAITRQREIDEIIQSRPFMTIAMSRDDEPYLVTVNHSYHPKTRSLYFHCAQKGKKTDFLSANGRVWGEVVDDMGYVEGECEYNYRSVHFSGNACMVESVKEKKRALGLMIEKLDKRPAALKTSLLVKARLGTVGVYRIDVSAFYGKKSMK